MRVLGVATLVAVFLGGCTSVRVVQRDGCWVKRTEKVFGRVREEIGPCSRAEPKWSDDRLTRLVQECVAQADYRWQAAALDAWRRGQPIPAQQREEKLLDACMSSQAAAKTIAENELLKKRLSELTADRDGLRTNADRTDAHLRATEDKLVTYLGEAAKKPAGSAVATATSTSDGQASSENGSTIRSESGSSMEPVAVQAERRPVANGSPATTSRAPPRIRAAGRAPPAPRCDPAVLCREAQGPALPAATDPAAPASAAGAK